jgi:hypothetical protein
MNGNLRRKRQESGDKRLNLLAFAFHTVSQLCVLAWRNAMTARGARYRFFEHLRTITAYIVFSDWTQLLQAIADPKARPP